jgi:hypothetical protein
MSELAYPVNTLTCLQYMLSLKAEAVIAVPNVKVRMETQISIRQFLHRHRKDDNIKVNLWEVGWGYEMDLSGSV